MRPSPLTDREAIWFARRLEDALEELHVTRAELGQRLGGKSGQYVSQLLNGSARPSRRRVGEIEVALRVGVGRLLVPPDVDDKPEESQWLLTAPLGSIGAELHGVSELVDAGCVAAAAPVLDALVERLEALDSHSDLARAPLVEALILRARARTHQMQGGLALTDIERARDLAERLGGDHAELALRAFFWHIYMTRDERGTEELVGVLDRLPPEAPRSTFAYLPLAIEALLTADHEAEHRVAARLAQAVRDAPYTPEKAAALHIVQCRVQDDTDWLGLWASEARAAGDTPSLATALYHATLRCFMEGDWRGAYTRLAEGLALAENAGCDRVFEWLASLAAQALRHPMVAYWSERGLDRAWLLAEIAPGIEETVRDLREGSRWAVGVRASASSALLGCLALRGDLGGLRELADGIEHDDGPWHCPSVTAAELSWAAVASGDAREPVWALALREIGQALREGDPVAGLRDVAFVAGPLLGEHRIALDVLAYLSRREPADAWVHALLAASCLASGDLSGAVEAAERGRDLMRSLPEEVAVQPVEFHRLPREKAHRRACARAELLGWLSEVFRAAGAARRLSGATRQRARRALDDLTAEARP